MDVVFLARHGTTEWNLAGRRQGQLDSPLSVEGLAGTRRAVAAVLRLGADAVYSSPLGRATTTAGIYAAALGLPVTVVDELKELDHGAMSGLTRTEIEARHPGLLAARSRCRYRWRFPGGESYEDADRRAATALAVIASEGARRPLVVSHEMIGRMLVRNLCDLGVDEALALSQPAHVVHRIDVASRTHTAVHLDAEQATL